jgi:hypothetical protein
MDPDENTKNTTFWGGGEGGGIVLPLLKRDTGQYDIPSESYTILSYNSFTYF